MKKCIISTLIAGIIMLALVSCGGKNNAAEKPAAEIKPSVDTVVTSVTITEPQFKNAEIRLGYLGDKDLSETIKASGTVDVPQKNYAQVSTYIGGVVKSILAQEGDFVRKGQTVITMEHPDFIKLQQEYINSKNNLIFLEKDYKRQKELVEGNAGAGKKLQEAESRYNAEMGNVSSLKNQLSMLSISTDVLDRGQIIRTVALKAPIAGYIGHLNISLGAYGEPNKTLFDITNNHQLIVQLNIFEKDAVKVKKGQKVFISLPNQDNGEIVGEIFSIGKSVDNETKTVSVRANVRDDKHMLIPGMFVNAFIGVSNNAAKVIPEDAIVRAGEKQFIFMATDAWCANPNIKNAVARENTPITEISEDSIALTYKMVEVQTGASTNGFVGVTSLERLSNFVLVVKGAYYLMSQLKSGEMVGCCDPAEGNKK